MDTREAASRLAKLVPHSGAVVRGVLVRFDDDLGAMVADVLWIVPAPAQNSGWLLQDLDALCALADSTLAPEVVSVFCRYRSEEEFKETREQDEQYFVAVNHVAA
jgi:hypothetical protein